ncbi:MAG: ABC transporter ATP-binding protein [Puniceicoccales bacterium]|jgi:ABC-type dipeptide/oligopeptide/nickel transport system ATPase component|nr:ABC transporter ATP-binding protein [Puniceicoccales bacterium]
MEPLIAVKNLDIAFLQQEVRTRVVKDVSFDIFPQEVLAIVGESGSGKSVTALSIMRLLPPPPYCTLGGEITYGQLNVLKLTEKQLRKIRGSGVAYVFQEPSTSFNPVFTIGYQISEAIRLHLTDVKDVKAYAIQLLYKVGLEGQRCYEAYPHELSGGMQQRAMIAMALACHPRVLIADEPTTALDVTIQKQIIELLKDLQRTEKLTIVLITHNFGIVRDFAQRVIVMFQGQIVEQGLSEQIITHPQHPYTQALIACIPTLGQRKERLKTIDYSAF